MLRINLSTRPFYNERAVHLLLGAAVLAAGAFLAAGILSLNGLSREQAALAAAADRDEAAAQAAASATAEILRSVAGGDPQRVADATADANLLIGRRLFSWTALLNHLEETLPGGVMLVSVQPRISAAGATVALDVVGRSIPEIGAFIDALEATGTFSQVLPRDEEATAEGGYRTSLIAEYVPPPPGAPAAREATR